MELVRATICVKAKSNVYAAKNVPDAFHIENGMKKKILS
jgi:hypothetical protein